MIDALNSKRMSAIVFLIIVCTIIVIIEEFFTNSPIDLKLPRAEQKETEKNRNIKGSKHQQEEELIKFKQQEIEFQEDLLKKQVNDWKFLLKFLSLMGFFGGISGLATKYRQQQLRCKTLARFRKQESRDSADSISLLVKIT